MRRLGSNYHLDSFRPWKLHRGVDMELGALPEAGLRIVRIVGDMFLPAEDQSGELVDDSLFRRVTDLCRRTATKILALCWNIVPDSLARAHPLVAADGTPYGRGNWYIFNFRDPTLREVALRISENTARRLAEATDVVEYYQPSNEWLLASYSPYGWNWKWYAGDSRRGTCQLVSYDDHAIAAWQRYLERLPSAWQLKILAETGSERLADVPPVRRTENGAFSPVYLAWARFNSASFGEFFAALYRRVKPVAGKLKIVSQAYMPFLTGAAAFPASAFGHNLEHWLDQGRCFDYLGVNTYQNYAGIAEAPYLDDGDLAFACHYSAYREIVRLYDVDGLITTECGANSYFLSEDAQRYTILRSLLQAVAYGNVETILQLLWNDDPQLEATHEQFFGVLRNKHALPKPAYRELTLLSRAFEHTTTHLPDTGFAYVLLSRMDMDVALSRGPIDLLSARELDLRVLTDHIYTTKELGELHRAVLVTDGALTSDAATIGKLASEPGAIVVPATIGRYGLDDDNERERAALALLGLSLRRFQDAESSVTGASDVYARPQAQIQLDVELGDLPVGTVVSIDVPTVRVRIGLDDLPADGEAIATFSDGTVALYRTGSRIISAFGLGRQNEHDYGRTLLSRAVAREIGTRTDIRRTVRNMELDSRLLVYDLGGVVAVVNATYDDAVAHLQVHDQKVELPVAAHRASLYGYATAEPFLVVSAAGTVRVDGEIVAEGIPAGATLVVDGALTELRPYYEPHGLRITSVRANGTELSYQVDHQGGVFTGTTSVPLSFDTSTEERVRMQATFVRRYPLRPEASGEAQFIEWSMDTPSVLDTTIVPDEVRLEWDETPEAARMSVTLEAFESGRWQIVWNKSMVCELTRGSVDADFSPAPHTRYRYHCELSNPSGTPIARNDPGRVALVFRFIARAVPTLTFALDEIAYDARMLHPMEYERCRIESLKAAAMTRCAWRDLTVYLGKPGQHIRHLLHAEDWQEIPW